MKEKKIIILIGAVVVALCVWVGVTFYNAYQPKKLVLQGEIDAQSYNISSKLPGRISKVFVKKGDLVKVGDAIFSISSPEVEAKLKQARAAKDAASAQKKQANNGARKQEIQAAKDQYEKAKVAEMLMKKTYQRIQKLYEQGVVSQQKKDEVYTKYMASVYTSNAAYQLANMAQEGARVEIKNAADAQERVYAGKLDEVNAYVKEINQYAFHQGEVSQILIHEGELSPTGFPVVSVIDMQDSWARLSVREDYLRGFKRGKIMEVMIPALDDKKHPFKVTYIAPQGDYATWKATESGKGFDMKSFEINMSPVEPIEGLRVGMSVLVALDN
jgi:HlyD family secretion protein